MSLIYINLISAQDSQIGPWASIFKFNSCHIFLEHKCSSELIHWANKMLFSLIGQHLVCKCFCAVELNLQCLNKAPNMPAFNVVALDCFCWVSCTGYRQKIIETFVTFWMENDIPLSYHLKTWQVFQRAEGFAFKRLLLKSRQMTLNNAVRQMFCFTLPVIILWIIKNFEAGFAIHYRCRVSFVVWFFTYAGWEK